MKYQITTIVSLLLFACGGAESTPLGEPKIRQAEISAQEHTETDTAESSAAVTSQDPGFPVYVHIKGTHKTVAEHTQELTDAGVQPLTDAHGKTLCAYPDAGPMIYVVGSQTYSFLDQGKVDVFSEANLDFVTCRYDTKVKLSGPTVVKYNGKERHITQQHLDKGYAVLGF